MKLFIESAEQKLGKKGPYYAIKTDHGNFSSGEDIRPYIGHTADFNTAVSTDGKYNYINKPLPEVPTTQEQNNSSTNGSLKDKMIILSYAKDIAVAYAPMLTKEECILSIKAAYDEMLRILKIEDEEPPF